MEREQIFLLMEIAIQEIMLLEKQMAREFINGEMRGSSMGTGRTIKWMAKAFSLGLTGEGSFYVI